MNELGSHRLVWILKAAVVLAALYAGGVLVLLALITVVGFRDYLIIEDLWSIATPFAVLFGFAFIVLAVARRIGFVLLWLVLMSLWLAILFGGGISDSFELLSRGIVYPTGFVLWSLPAFPLFAMSSMASGRGALLKIGPWSASASFTIGILWVLLVVGGIILEVYAHPHWASMSSAITLAALGWILWAPMPLVIAAVSVRRFWIASRPEKLTDSAA